MRKDDRYFSTFYILLYTLNIPSYYATFFKSSLPNLEIFVFSAGKVVASSISLEIPIEGPTVSFEKNANQPQNIWFPKRLQSCAETGEIYSLSRQQSCSLSTGQFIRIRGQ